MIKKEDRKLFYFLLISHLYCLVSGWFNGADKINYPRSFFWHFLAWWCTWNSIITLVFILWKLKRPKTNTYFSQLFSLITMISNVITMVIYGLGLIIWLTTILTNHFGITKLIHKLVPIPSHAIVFDHQLFKVIQWWIYSPIWHFIAPIYFIVWFFRHERTELLKKKLKLTILFCFIQPALYYIYGYARSKLGDREYFKKFNSRWIMGFLSAKRMLNKLGINSPRYVWKISLFLFWFILFSLLVYLTLKYEKNIRIYLSEKKKNLTNKSKKNSHFRLNDNNQNNRKRKLINGQ